MLNTILNQEIVNSTVAGIIIVIVTGTGGLLLRVCWLIYQRLESIADLKEDHRELKEDYNITKSTVAEHSSRIRKIEIHVGHLPDY